MGAATYCPDASVITLTIAEGFKNARVIPNAYANYFLFETMDVTKTFYGDKSTANVVATAEMT